MSVVHVIHENGEWSAPLFEALAERGLPFRDWHMASGHIDLGRKRYFADLRRSASPRATEQAAGPMRECHRWARPIVHYRSSVRPRTSAP